MSTLLNSRKALITLAVIVAVVAIVVPTCRMIGCSMEMGDVMPFGHQMVAGFFADCGGTYVMNGAPSAVVPSGADALTTALIAAVFGALALFAPRMAVSRVVAFSASPPLQPEPPLGVRLRL